VIIAPRMVLVRGEYFAGHDTVEDLVEILPTLVRAALEAKED
jgi:hypothetical protein